MNIHTLIHNKSCTYIFLYICILPPDNPDWTEPDWNISVTCPAQLVMKHWNPQVKARAEPSGEKDSDTEGCRPRPSNDGNPQLQGGCEPN